MNEKYKEKIIAVLDKICHATERRSRTLAWFGLTYGYYIAWWENICVLVYDCTDNKYELHIVDSAWRHESVIIKEAEFYDNLQILHAAVSLQLERRYSCRKICNNKLGFLEYVSNNL
jgi:hypothetical protein